MQESITLCESLVVVRVSQGVRLIKPRCHDETSQGYSLRDLKSAPFSVYLLDKQGKTCYLNDAGAHICGFTQPEASLGKTIHEVTKNECADTLIKNCSIVIERNQIQIFDEDNQRKDDINLHFLSIKAPWYDDKGVIIGIMGISIAMGHHSLSQSLSMVKQMGLMDKESESFSGLSMNDIKLTNRELECLKLTIKGYTAKRIAKELNISFRTVEEYIANIRHKTGASSKAELIELTIENFYS